MAESASPRTKVVIASLIALTSMLGAVAAWRASDASNAATGAERKGFADAIAREQRRATIGASLDRTMLDYLRGRGQEMLADRLEQEAEDARSGDDAARLRTHAEAFRSLADLTNEFVDRDAVRPDGSLDLSRKERLEWEQAAREADLDPRPEFALADRMKQKSERLVGLTGLLIAAAFFFTLAQISRSRARILYAAGGGGVLVAATFTLVIVELL